MKNPRVKKNARLFGVTLIFLVVATPGAQLAAEEFNPSALVSDERFADIETLGGVEGIQKFLETQGSVLASASQSFLEKLREPGDTGLKSRLPDPRPDLGRVRTAAELIFDASISAGLNPQVVLVTLQKEQTLITGKFDTEKNLQRALDRALGFGCPDEGGCSELFLGFYYQLFGNFDASGNRYIGMPMSLMKSFNYEVGGVRIGRGPMVDANNNAFGNTNRVRTARRGDIIGLENTIPSPYTVQATQSVTLSNFATTALYRYTPHVYNGNYNFWRFFNAWFKYPNGTLVQTSGDTKIYVLDSGLRRQISAFVISQRKLDLGKLVVLSPSEFSEYSLGDVMPPADGTILKNSLGQHYLIEGGKRKLLSSFVATQRKISLGTATAISVDELASYTDGGRALPEEGTLVKSADSQAVYIIANQEKRLLSYFVFQQRGFKFSQVLSAQPGELDGYPTGKLMPPLDGTLIKAKESPAVYLVGNGVLQPVSYFVFTQKKFSFRNVVSVPSSELAGWEVGKPLPPPTGLLVKSKSSSTVYYIESGVKRPISYGVFVARRFSFKNVVVADDQDLAVLETGDDLTLPDRALVKTAENPTVYYLVDGVFRPLALKAFQNRRLRFEDVVTVTADELAKYPIGGVVEN